MSQLFVEGLTNESVKNICIASRDIKNSINFSDKFGTTPIQFEDIKKHIADSDIIFTSTGSNEFILKKGDFDEVKSKDKLIVDIALPRDVDPRVGDLDFCYLYDLDDFKNLSSDNKNAYSSSIKDANLIITKNVETFESWIETSNVKDVILSFQEHIESLVKDEIKNSDHLNKEIFAAKISNKILHEPLTKIKTELKFDKTSIRIIEDLFNLQKSNKNPRNIKEINEARNKNRN